MSSPKQQPNVAFADALERARQIAAKLGATSGSSSSSAQEDNLATKRPQPLMDSPLDEPSLKKPAVGSTEAPISPQLATLKAQQVAKQINEQLGIFKPAQFGVGSGRNDYSEDFKVGPNGNVGQSFGSASTVGPGRQAEIIKRLSDQYGVKITLVDEQGGLGQNQPIRITGDPEKVSRARLAIQQLASSGSGSLQGVYGEYGNRTSDEKVNEFQYNVPAEKAGIVIGKGGESIKEINRRSGAYVEIDRTQNQKTPCTPGSFKTFNIRGTQEQIRTAQHLIYDKCVNSHGGAPTMTPPPGHPSLTQPPTPSTNSYAAPKPLMSQHPSSQLSHHHGSYPMSSTGGMTPADMHAAYSSYYGHGPMGNPNAPMMHGDMFNAGSAPGMYSSVVGNPGMMQHGYGMHSAMSTWHGYGADPWNQQMTSGNVNTSGAMPPMHSGSAVGDPTKPTATDWTDMYGAGGQYDMQRQHQPIQSHTPLLNSSQMNPSVVGSTTAPIIPNPMQSTSIPSQQQGLPATEQTACSNIVSAPPVTNPQTGQADYSLAWAEYYRNLGLHDQADYILSHAVQNNLIPNASTQPTPSNDSADSKFSNQQSSNTTNLISSNPNCLKEPDQQPPTISAHHHTSNPAASLSSGLVDQKGWSSQPSASSSIATPDQNLANSYPSASSFEHIIQQHGSVGQQANATAQTGYPSPMMQQSQIPHLQASSHYPGGIESASIGTGSSSTGPRMIQPLTAGGGVPMDPMNPSQMGLLNPNVNPQWQTTGIPPNR